MTIQWGSEIRTFKIQKHLKSGLFEGPRFSNGRALAMAIALVPTIWNLDIFVPILNVFLKNGSYLSIFQMVGLPDFRSHLKSEPCATQPPFDHLKFRLVQISDPHCIFIWIPLDQFLTDWFFYHFKTGLVRYSDHYCIFLTDMSNEDHIDMFPFRGVCFLRLRFGFRPGLRRRNKTFFLLRCCGRSSTFRIVIPAVQLGQGVTLAQGFFLHVMRRTRLVYFHRNVVWGGIWKWFTTRKVSFKVYK